MMAMMRTSAGPSMRSEQPMSRKDSQLIRSNALTSSHSPRPIHTAAWKAAEMATQRPLTNVQSFTPALYFNPSPGATAQMR